VFCNVARLDMERFYAYMGLMWGLYSNENEYGLLHHYMHNCARRRLGCAATLTLLNWVMQACTLLSAHVRKTSGLTFPMQILTVKH
jgi:hypothetical protein